LFYALSAYIFGGEYWGWTKYGFAGYWFTIVLFQMYVTYLMISLLFKKLNKEWLVAVTMVVISVILLVILISFRGDSRWWNVLSMENLTKYFQFFTFGILVKKYFDRFVAFISKETVKAFITVLYISFLLVYFNDGLQTQFPIIFQAVHDIFSRYAGLLIVFVLFYSNRTYFDRQTFAPRCLSYIGKRTLDIYMIHYLLLPNLMFLQCFLTNGNRIVFQLVIALSVALAVVAVCLIVSKILRSNKYTTYFLFGVKS
jgi:surface polysaccharide O-acyltransferase-like enzyme